MRKLYTNGLTAKTTAWIRICKFSDPASLDLLAFRLHNHRGTSELGSSSRMTARVRKLQYRCAGLSSCQLAACCFVQAREPTTGIIVIDSPAALDCADAINNLSSLIKFKR